MKGAKITKVESMEVLDSRGYPTLKTTVYLESGKYGAAYVPSGASTGKYEAVELRDNDKSRFLGKGVLKAVNNVNTTIANALTGIDGSKQEEIDKIMIELDGTPNKANLGANAILSVSLAVSKAVSNNVALPLYKYLGGDNSELTIPVPMCNVINGGAHASNNVDIQEFMIVPTGAGCFSEGLRYCAEIFQYLKIILKEKRLSIAVGDEGGFAPDLSNNEEALKLLVEAIKKAGHNEKINFALDAASSEWLKNGKYTMPKTRETYTRDEIISYWEKLSERYPIISIEDGLEEEDWETWQKLNSRLGNKIQLVGDDLFVTNTARLKKGIEENSANSILIKPNQIGTLTETINAINMAKRAGFTTIMSHRSGETEDSTIADLAVGLGTDQIKTGSLSRSERIAKYNRLLCIEKELGNKALYKGRRAFKK